MSTAGLEKGAADLSALLQLEGRRGLMEHSRAQRCAWRGTWKNVRVTFGVLGLVLPLCCSKSLELRDGACTKPRIRYPAPERLVAIGDLHGDIDKARRALRLAGVLHERSEEWVGGETVNHILANMLEEHLARPGQN